MIADALWTLWDFVYFKQLETSHITSDGDEMWGDHQISDIRCIAHTVQRRCLTVYRPPPPLYGCTGHRRPPRVDRDPATAAANTTQLQRHSVGNRSWARPLVCSLQLQTPWSVIISRHRPITYREELSLPGEQRTERWRQCDPGRSGDHARVRGHPDIAWHHDTPRTL